MKKNKIVKRKKKYFVLLLFILSFCLFISFFKSGSMPRKIMEGILIKKCVRKMTRGKDKIDFDQTCEESFFLVCL